MKRALIISFEFEGKNCLALACINTSVQDETSYSIKVYDDALTRILPENSLGYTDQKPLCPSSLKHPSAMRLFSCIGYAVSCHVEASRVVVKQSHTSTIR
jgi:hypothetical protein